MRESPDRASALGLLQASDDDAACREAAKINPLGRKKQAVLTRWMN